VAPETIGAHSWINGRRGLILAAGALTIGSVGLGWPWLAAAGLAPIILSAVPCLAMCSLGLCMRGMGQKSCQAGDAATSKIDTTNSNDPSLPAPTRAAIPTLKGYEHA